MAHDFEGPTPPPSLHTARPVAKSEEKSAKSRKGGQLRHQSQTGSFFFYFTLFLKQHPFFFVFQSIKLDKGELAMDSLN
jgi:hypothetical protein